VYFLSFVFLYSLRVAVDVLFVGERHQIPDHVFPFSPASDVVDVVCWLACYFADHVFLNLVPEEFHVNPDVFRDAVW